MFALFILLGSLVLGILDGFVFGSNPSGRPKAVMSSVFQLALLLPFLAAASRRLHDTGRSGVYLAILGPLPLVLALELAAVHLFTVSALLAAPGDGTMERLTVLFGISGLVLLALVQLTCTGGLIWALSRPSQPGANVYGPAPLPRPEEPRPR